MDADFLSNLPLTDFKNCREKNVTLIQTEQEQGLTTLLINILLDIHYTDLIKILDLIGGELRSLHFFQKHATKQQFTHVKN